MLAFAFRNTRLCLLAGIWVGATLIVGGNLLAGLFWVGYEGILRHALRDRFRLEILVFIFGLVGTVGIMSRMGGVAGMLQAARRAVRGVRSTQLFASAMGFLVFFDDYANTILVGTTMRPLTDRWRISRERLAYIVDSTAAPVAGLSALSTWVAYEMSLYADQLPAAGVHQDAYIVFLRTLPYRFYSIFTLVLLLFGSAMNRSFGPMLAAERRARGGAVAPTAERRGRAEQLSAQALRRTEAKPGLPARWVNAALPLGLIIAVTLLLMFHYGDSEGRGLAALADVDYLRGTVLAGAESSRALAWASIAGFVAALLLARGQPTRASCTTRCRQPPATAGLGLDRGLCGGAAAGARAAAAGLARRAGCGLPARGPRPAGLGRAGDRHGSGLRLPAPGRPRAAGDGRRQRAYSLTGSTWMAFTTSVTRSPGASCSSSTDSVVSTEAIAQGTSTVNLTRDITSPRFTLVTVAWILLRAPYCMAGSFGYRPATDRSCYTVAHSRPGAYP